MSVRVSSYLFPYKDSGIVERNFVIFYCEEVCCNLMVRSNFLLNRLKRMAYASAHLYRNYGVTKNISSKRCAEKHKKVSPSCTFLPYLSQREYKQAVLLAFEVR
jgi:hypothetical protein